MKSRNLLRAFTRCHVTVTRQWLSLLLMAVFPAIGRADTDWESLPYTKHRQLQASLANGSPAFSGDSFPIKLTGVILNNPSDMLDGTPNFIPWSGGSTAFALGAQWQMFIQSVDPADQGGTALYMAQNYGNFPWVADSLASYSNEQWLGELQRLTLDGTLEVGDLVEVRARVGLPFGGKYNVNEAHSNDPDNDFEIVVLQKNHGLPSPVDITISDVKNELDQDIFDFTGNIGGERFQSQLVRLQNVHLMSDAGWTPDGEVFVTDESGRTLRVKLGLNKDFLDLEAPLGAFDVVGIFNQESSGYQIWVMDPQGIAAVPEASTFVLVSAASGLGIFWHRRRRAGKGTGQ
ncbi:MAG: hypothetical protein U1D30_21815 [Planctomycetota bacterium]